MAISFWKRVLHKYFPKNEPHKATRGDRIRSVGSITQHTDSSVDIEGDVDLRDATWGGGDPRELDLVLRGAGALALVHLDARLVVRDAG